ncbi:hypothetical protein JXB37_04680 [candidate division WOR-3 bacterium]|nr:hypothetical protein [candidate division WOR-3 bacterium]
MPGFNRGLPTVLLQRAGIVLLLALAGCFSDLLVTQEPDAFFSARPPAAGQADIGLRVFHTGWLPTEHAVYGISAAYGIGHDWEARAGWALAGSHWRRSDSTNLWLNAVELRGRRQLLAEGPFRLAAGAGLDLVLADPDRPGPVEYYGLRPLLQAAAGVYSDFGLGIFVPLAVSATFLRPEHATGWSITPGVGMAFEHQHFFLRAAGNYPLGRFCEAESLRLREMMPSAGFEVGGRFSLIR